MSGCVEDTTVIGDERSRLACMDAVPLDAPPFGCTSVVLESRAPYGCSVQDGAGGWVEELAGSWVRLHRATDQEAIVRVTVLDTTGACGPAGCTGAAHLTTFGTAPCACLLGSLESAPLALGETWERTLDAADQEVLLEPLGASFEVSLCTGVAPLERDH